MGLTTDEHCFPPWGPKSLQLDEQSERVWQAATGCAVHLMAHGGYWVRDAAAHIPPLALRGLMRACLEYGWAPELHSHLAELVPVVLANSCSTGWQCSSRSQDSSFEAAVPAAASLSVPGSRQSGSDTWRLGGIDAGRLVAFGGPSELLHHFSRASAPGAQRCLLLPLLQLCMPPGEHRVDSIACLQYGLTAMQLDLSAAGYQFPYLRTDNPFQPHLPSTTQRRKRSRCSTRLRHPGGYARPSSRAPISAVGWAAWLGRPHHDGAELRAWPGWQHGAFAAALFGGSRTRSSGDR